ncbi:hypothetical protein [Agarivorans gilvus]|uniref:Uncharacterized protein n=1 Tax=Agarivorans gilvus TaxID=680279 RepID=A0ABQ1HZV7_9ALTE|nr:hypothetical protein [Agarivorans gilvus]GGA95736.1 hypothetical protein GCM10007414_05690 [Agarivorans gilvus]
MTRIIQAKRVLRTRNVSLLELDADSVAERYFVMDRKTLSILKADKLPSGMVKLILPAEYSLTQSVLVGIVDDNQQYNAAVADGVVLQSVDATELNMS